MSIFLKFMIMIEHQFDVKIQSVQNDEGELFKLLFSFLENLEIVYRKTYPHTSE